MDNSAWHPGDKEWLAQRKTEWRLIQKHLKIFSRVHFRGEYLKHHKELFFYGRIDPEVEEKYGDDYFDWALPLFIFWYHPEPSETVFQQIIDTQINAAPLNNSREYLLETFPAAAKFDTEYGMMGGREELMVKILVPSFDPAEEKIFVEQWVNASGKKITRTTKYPLCLHPNLIARYCLNGIMPHIFGSKKNPYAPGQYLFDHFSILFGQVTDEYSIGDLRRLSKRVLTYETDEDFPSGNPTAVALAKKLKTRYENRDFSEAMLAVWDEEKAKLDSA